MTANYIICTDGGTPVTANHLICTDRSTPVAANHLICTDRSIGVAVNYFIGSVMDSHLLVSIEFLEPYEPSFRP